MTDITAPDATTVPDVLIVGAGLAGLSCALHLQRAGLTVQVLEAGDGVGGRVRTDVLDGFQLDRGFQVLLSAYPEAKSLLDFKALAPGHFGPGALVRFRDRWHRISDPYRDPTAALRSLFGPIGTLGDKLRVARLRGVCRSGIVADQFKQPERSTAEFLSDFGFTSSLIERFWRPFMGGVFLDPDLRTSSRMFRFVFRMFAEGSAVLPKQGMGAIPDQLAAGLAPGTIRLNTPVAEVARGQVVLASGEVRQCRAVVVATDGTQAAQWAEGIAVPEWCRTTCLYFAVPQAPITLPVLMLNGDGDGPINNLCFPTRVVPEYGPGDADLASVTVVGDRGADPALLPQVQAQLGRWFGPEAGTWRHLRTYQIARALPRQEPGWLEPPQRPVRSANGLYLAGDHLETASTNGALAAGRRAAEAILADEPSLPRPGSPATGDAK